MHERQTIAQRDAIDNLSRVFATDWSSSYPDDTGLIEIDFEWADEVNHMVWSKTFRVDVAGNVFYQYRSGGWTKLGKH